MEPTTAQWADGSVTVSGVRVSIPVDPYPSQLELMRAVVECCDSSTNGLLESPTGTGKTLALLCAALAWQERAAALSEAGGGGAGAGAADGGGGGGGQGGKSGGCSVDGASEPAAGKRRKHRDIGGGAPAAGAARAAPKIFFTTRTHSQIAQIISELRKTRYLPKIAVLSSREHTCINPAVAKGTKKNEECKKLVEARGCQYYGKAGSLRTHRALAPGGEHELWDIEDLVAVGRRAGACPYYAAKLLAAGADVVFCPYTYLMDQTVRAAMDIDISGCVLIVDEAHNIEATSRESASFDAELTDLQEAAVDCARIARFGSFAEALAPLTNMVDGTVGWLLKQVPLLKQREYEQEFKVYAGSEITRMLSAIGVTEESMSLLLRDWKHVRKLCTDAKSNEPRLSPKTTFLLEQLFVTLNFLRGSGTNVSSFRLVVTKESARGFGAAARWQVKMKFSCLHPAVAFRPVSNLARCVILTSGTLSPIGAFTSELGALFPVTVEAQHIVDTASQLWVGVLSAGRGGVKLNASFKHAHGYQFIDAVGDTLLGFCGIVPHGVLCFFPSYKLLNQMRVRWASTDMWAQLKELKDIHVEPSRAGADFDKVVRQYQKAVVRSKDAKATWTGAVFLAVCRGKVSEGIDFANDNARGIFTVGVPFPNATSIEIKLKKDFNNGQGGLLSGSRWYAQQAYRALNQAVGRCIRHRNDYGAILFVDERMAQTGSITQLSKWLRQAIRTDNQHDLDATLGSVRDFIRTAGPAIEHRAEQEAAAARQRRGDAKAASSSSDAGSGSRESGGAAALSSSLAPAVAPAVSASEQLQQLLEGELQQERSSIASLEDQRAELDRALNSHKRKAAEMLQQITELAGSSAGAAASDECDNADDGAHGRAMDAEAAVSDPPPAAAAEEVAAQPALVSVPANAESVGPSAPGPARKPGAEPAPEPAPGPGPGPRPAAAPELPRSTKSKRRKKARRKQTANAGSLAGSDDDDDFR